MERLVAVLLVIILALFPASGHDISIRQPGSEDDDHRSVLEQLRDRFVSFRARVQYGVLYLPPPYAVGREIIFEPDVPINDLQPAVLFPEIDPGAPGEWFEHNFAVANIDFRGLVYGSLMEREYTIHTENLFVNLVYPRMLPWYTHHFNGDHPNLIYIFTHHLPCRFCDILIRNLTQINQRVRIFVGYTDLYLNREASNDTLRLAAQRRRDSLNNFLNNHGGGLFQLPNNESVCQQEGQSVPMSPKRALPSATCPVSTENRIFIITMDFSTGKAVAEFCDIPANDYGWIGLFSSATAESHLTYERTNGKTSGRTVFDKYLSDGMQVRYFNGSYPTDLAITSYRWWQCGYDWTVLHKLPNGQGELKMKIVNGIINVGFKSGTYHPDSWDWIAIQSMNQLNSQDYWTWQWVSSFEGPNNARWWNSGYYPDSGLSSGFRAKYIYNTNGYKWEGMYDNATPFWTSNCRGTAK